MLKGWLKVLRRLRNICAHQGRLWNRKIDARISFDIAGRPELLDLFNAISPQKELRHTSMFVALCIARQMLTAVRPESKWADRLKDLLADYPEVPLAAMGFPADWQMLALWKEFEADKEDDEADDSSQACPSKPDSASGDSSAAPAPTTAAK